MGDSEAMIKFRLKTLSWVLQRREELSHSWDASELVLPEIISAEFLSPICFTLKGKVGTVLHNGELNILCVTSSTSIDCFPIFDIFLDGSKSSLLLYNLHMENAFVLVHSFQLYITIFNLILN
jgi:hypothetical protein